MENPRISVVMSVYKEPVEWLKQSIDSIINQTFKDFEFIIICDNPCYEDGISLLKDYQHNDDRIKLIFNKKNIGLTKSLNKGLAVAKGEYIARMDADDISVFDRFQKQIDYMESHPFISVCGSAISFFGNKSGMKSYPADMDNICLFIESCFAHPTVMIRKKILGDLCYNESYVVSQDYNMWVELFARDAVFGNLNIPLLHYRYSNQQIMSQKGSLQIQLSKQIRRKALREYYKKKNLDYTFDDCIWYIEYAEKIIKDLNLYNNKELVKELYYYSFLSLKKNFLWTLLNISIYLFKFKLRLCDALRILYFKIRKIDFTKY